MGFESLNQRIFSTSFMSPKIRTKASRRDGIANSRADLGVEHCALMSQDVHGILLYWIEETDEPFASQPGGCSACAAEQRSPDSRPCRRAAGAGAASQRHGEHLRLHVHLDHLPHRCRVLQNPRAFISPWGLDWAQDRKSTRLNS